MRKEFVFTPYFLALVTFMGSNYSTSSVLKLFLQVMKTPLKNKASFETMNNNLIGFTRPMILLLGSERQGLSPEQAAICEVMLHLPMKGRTTSLNLAVAAGVMLYQMSV